MSQSDLSGRLARWSLKLQGYKFRIEHRKGSNNVVPDALSRIHCDTVSRVAAIHIDLDAVEFSDPEYVNRALAIANTKRPHPKTKVVNNKILICPDLPLNKKDGVEPAWKLWLPTKLIPTILEQAHLPPTSAHCGVAKMLDHIKRQYYWPQMARNVKTFVKNCQTCKHTKAVNYTTQPLMGEYKEFTRPWQKLYIDFLGPYPRSAKGNKVLLIVMDHFSKFVLLKALRDATTSKVIEFLEKEVFTIFSVPEVIHSDNGTQFTSKDFQNFLKEHGIRHFRTPHYSPQSNASERVNRSILSAIRAYIKENHKKWDTHLHEIASALRNTIHQSTKHSPAYLVFGQQMIQHGSEYETYRLLGDTGLEDQQLSYKIDRLNKAREMTTHYLKLAHKQNARRYNLRSRAREFQVGQTVCVRNFVQSKANENFSAKLAKKFVPAKIAKKIGKVSYELVNENGKNLGIFHIKDIIN